MGKMWADGRTMHKGKEKPCRDRAESGVRARINIIPPNELDESECCTLKVCTGILHRPLPLLVPSDCQLLQHASVHP